MSLNLNINKNLDTKLLKNVLPLLTNDDLNKVMAKHELINCHIKKNNYSKNEIVKLLKKNLKKFQKKKLGCYIEDLEWSYYENSTDDFDVDENDCILVNTIANGRQFDSDTVFFMDTLIEKINNSNDNYVLYWTCNKCDEHKIGWIIIWITFKDQNSEHSYSYKSDEDSFDDSEFSYDVFNEDSESEEEDDESEIDEEDEEDEENMETSYDEFDVETTEYSQ